MRETFILANKQISLIFSVYFMIDVSLRSFSRRDNFVVFAALLSVAFATLNFPSMAVSTNHYTCLDLRLRTFWMLNTLSIELFLYFIVSCFAGFLANLKSN